MISISTYSIQRLIVFIIVIILISTPSICLSKEKTGVIVKDENTYIEVQKRLSQLGYNVGEIDGIWGERTKKALVSFQLNSGVNPNGLLGGATMRKLFTDDYSPSPNTNEGEFNKEESKNMDSMNKLYPFVITALTCTLLLMFVIIHVLFKSISNVKNNLETVKNTNLLNKKMIEKKLTLRINEIFSKELDAKILEEFNSISIPYIKKSMGKEIPDSIDKRVREEFESNYKHSLNKVIDEMVSAVVSPDLIRIMLYARVNEVCKDSDVSNFLKNEFVKKVASELESSLKASLKVSYPRDGYRTMETPSVSSSPIG